jgi:hypothetical protein
MMGGYTGQGMTPAPASREGVGGYLLGSANTKPLTIDQAKQAVEIYVNRLNNPDLESKKS